MSARGILDADMQTIARWLLDGWRWWVEEIAGLVPRRWRGAGADRLPRLTLVGETLVQAAGARRTRGARAGQDVAIVVPPGRGLVRRVERPAMSRRELDQMIALDGETLFPFPGAATVVGARTVGPGHEPGRTTIEVAGLPIDTARTIVAAAATAGVRPARIVMEAPGAEPAAIDFTAAMRSAGLIVHARGAAAPIWVLVAFLALLNLATLIWRDAAAVDRIDDLVAGQAPAVAVAQTIARRIAADRALVARSLAARRRHAALDDLAAISRAMPAGAWVQRYVWDGETVRVVGYKDAKVDVIGALRRAGRYIDVRSASDESQPDTPAGQPFDIAARSAVR